MQFKDEPGEGSGVSRAFFSTMCEHLLSNDLLPMATSEVSPMSRAQHEEVGRVVAFLWLLICCQLLSLPEGERQAQLMDMLLRTCMQDPQCEDMRTASTLVTDLVESSDAMAAVLEDLKTKNIKTLVSEKLSGKVTAFGSCVQLGLTVFRVVRLTHLLLLIQQMVAGVLLR